MELPQVQRTSTQVLISRTGLENTVLTKPQHQNTAGNVFGGFLLRACYDLAYSTIFAFTGEFPTVKEISEFTFDKPVPQRALLRLKSRVVYTCGTDACVEVLLIVMQPDKRTTFRANKILIVFNANAECAEVLPHTLSEAQAQLVARM